MRQFHEETVIAGKKVFSVADGYLIACFDKDVTEETLKVIVQKHPFYAVFRDSGMTTAMLSIGSPSWVNRIE